MKVKITKKHVEGAQPGQKDIFLWDTELGGFGVKVTPKGKRVFILQYRAAGRLRRYTIGRHGDLTPDQARREAIRLLGIVASGHDPALNKAQNKAAITISELSQRYLREHAEPKKKPLSVKQDQRLLNQIILPALGRLKLQAISRAEVAKLHHDLRGTPTQANRVLALLSKMLNIAEKWGLRPDGSNPCRHIDRYKEKKIERYLSEDELSRLNKALKEAESKEMPSAILAIKLLLLTGARVSEILTLKWEFVDLKHGLLSLPDSKTGAKLIVLPKPAVDLLTNALYLEENPYVCFGEKPGSRLVGLQKIWERIRGKADLDDVRLHDLRHNFASVAAAANMGLPIIGALLGHSQPATTARYAHLALDTKREAAELIAQKIDESMNQPARTKVIPFPKAGGND